MNRLTANKSADFDQFTDMMHALLNAAWGEGWGTFTEAYPNGTDPQNVCFPVVTYLLKEKLPGVIGNGNTREIKPRFRQEIYTDGDSDGPKVLNIFSQVFDCTVVFEVWEENHVKASAVASRFEDFMTIYKGYFMQNGVGQIIFKRMNNTPETMFFKDNVVCRKFEYLVRLEKHSEIPSDVLEKVTGEVVLRDNFLDDSIDNQQSIKLRK